MATECTPEEYKIAVEVTKVTDPMTGKDVYNVPEPYQRDTSDTCDYSPPQVSLSISGNKLYASVRKGSSDVAGYTLYVNGVEQSGISLGGDGAVNGFTLKSDQTLKFVVTDTAGYSATAEIVTKTVPASGSSSNSDKTKEHSSTSDKTKEH